MLSDNEVWGGGTLPLSSCVSVAGTVDYGLRSSGFLGADHELSGMSGWILVSPKFCVVSMSVGVSEMSWNVWGDVRGSTT